MDPFQQLPTEILYLIIPQIRDFVGLDSLLQLSPRVRAIFSKDPVAIAEDALLSCSITSDKILELFQEDALIRSPSSHFPNLQAYAAHASSLNKADFRLHYAGRPSSELYFVMRDMVRVAAHIQRLACACLSDMLHKLHLAAHANPALPKSAQTAAIRKPSWVEEYRIYRAIWHLHLVADLHKASRKDAVPGTSSNTSWGGWDWSPQESQQVKGWYSMERIARTFMITEARAVSQVLLTITGTENHDTPLYADQIPLYPSPQIGEPAGRPIWCPPPLPRNTAIEKTWHQSISYAQRGGTAQWNTFRMVRNSNAAIEPARIPALDPTSKELLLLHYLGIFFWDRWRVHCLGLVFNHPHEKQLIPDGEGVFRDLESYTAETEIPERWNALIQKAFEGDKMISSDGPSGGKQHGER